uniref:MICAL like 1 n=1 Tax=Sparus aurata TaxID=8175 RepID=A0A671UNI1_SPAAU
MISPKALREWCRVTCAHYPNVEIKNMSTSFRDGLAFCAIIHRHRPDLIDFSSLSKDNVFQNNKLAFEIAETKLGIPALLDPNDMTSSKVPDCLSVITYLSQYYYFFNRKCYGGLSSISLSTNLETSREDRLANTRPKTVCRLCFKPVHLIQRHWIDGKVYHRSCFRCKVCRSTLLPGSYTQGSEAGSKSSHRVFNQQIGSADSRPKRASQTGHFSLGGLAITTVPHYAKKTDVKDRAIEEAGKAGPAAILADSKTEQEVTEGSSRPVPAPRRMLGSSVVPVPAPRTKTSQETNSSSAAGKWTPCDIILLSLFCLCLACKENPFDRKPAIPKSKSFQVLPSRRAPAPGHGFPLIKRKVQTDQNISTENLQVEMRELDKHLEAMEQRGVELERNLRDCKNEEEQMLMEWFSLIHEKQVLVRRDTELVFLTKQQKLEERQADVEYELRCLLNKPESDWSQKDRDQEQQHMDELVAIIEQRNQIISSLDQDRLREREEDMLLEAMMKNKELQKEELKELKKSKGKFKPTKVLKMLNHRAESTKDSMDKKS